MKKVSPLKIALLFLLTGAAVLVAFKFFRHQEPQVISAANDDELLDKSDRAENPVAREEYEFNMIKNPKTGDIPIGVFEAELAQARSIYAKQVHSKVAANTYTFQGPNNLGGRVRSIKYDVRFNGTSNQVILAGGVSGGVFKSMDNGATWVRKSPTNQLYSVTSIAQDPRPGFQDTWYYGTGELIGNSASETGAAYRGNGVYKSTDNGETWTRLPNSNPGALEAFDRQEDHIMKVVVNPANGHVYMACLYGIQRSTDGGNTWSAPLLSSGSAFISTLQITDLVITSTGSRLYAAFGGQSCQTSDGCVVNNVPGVWTSTTGDAGSWTKIAGATAATNPANWDINNSYRRVVLALAPSNQNILYAMYDDGDVNPNPEAELYRWDQATTTWADRSNMPDEPGNSVGNDPFAVQTGYNLVIGVKPDDENVVYIGGTNIYRSTDGFSSTANTTRIGGYNSPANYASYPNSHADIHVIEFQPGSSTIMICGNDGGIQRTADAMAATVAWTNISTGFRTYQYYKVAIDPRNASGKVMGGAQDNGTTRNVGEAGTNFESVWGGDGVSVGLSNDVGGGNFVEYMGTQNGSAVRRLSSVAIGFANANIRPAAAVDNGLFVTLFHLDPDNSQTLYYCSDSSIYRTTSASTVTTAAGWTNLTGVQTGIVDGFTPKTIVTTLATTRGTYNPATASLFIGTNEGRVYRLDDPANVAAGTAPVNITGAFPAGGYVSSIAVNPRNDDTVLVTFSNYGITSVFWTGNANAATPTWLNVEGNLTLPSYRSSAIAITNDGPQYFVGTSVGLYVASINAASPGTTVWSQEGATEIGNAVVGTMALRPIDNRLLIGTHGYGMWATTLTGAGLPVNFTSFTGRVEDKQNRLQWTVENEFDNQGYEIQRKYKHEAGFSKVGFVAAKSANASANSYAFPDQFIDLGQENVAYRLKQIDIDGDITYSSTITLSRKISTRLVEYLSVRGSNLLMRLNGQNNQLVTFRLFDSNGRVLKQTQLADRTQDVSLVGLPRGTFIVEITHPDGRRHSQKIVY